MRSAVHCRGALALLGRSAPTPHNVEYRGGVRVVRGLDLMKAPMTAGSWWASAMR